MATLAFIDPNILYHPHPSPPSSSSNTGCKSAATPLRELSPSEEELSDLFSSDSNSSIDSETSDATATGLNNIDSSNAELPVLYRGRMFDDKDEAKAAIGLLSLKQGGASVRVASNNSHKLILACCEAGNDRQGCGFRVYLKPVPHSQRYEVRSFFETHTCSVDNIPRRTMLKQSWFVRHTVSNCLATLSVYH